MQNSVVTQSLVFVLVGAFVVFRFAQRELKERTVRGGVLWIRPAILVVVTAWLTWTSVTAYPDGRTDTFVALIAGAILGIVTGALIIANTQFAPAGVPNAVRVRGSRVTFAIWVGAFVVRIAARFVIPHSANPLSQLPLNCGLVALIAAAFVVIAWAFHRAVGRFGRAGSSLAM